MMRAIGFLLLPQYDGTAHEKAYGSRGGQRWRGMVFDTVPEILQHAADIAFADVSRRVFQFARRLVRQFADVFSAGKLIGFFIECHRGPIKTFGRGLPVRRCFV
jgi:hypothetical protein